MSLTDKLKDMNEAGKKSVSGFVQRREQLMEDAGVASYARGDAPIRQLAHYLLGAAKEIRFRPEIAKRHKTGLDASQRSREMSLRLQSEAGVASYAQNEGLGKQLTAYVSGFVTKKAYR